MTLTLNYRNLFTFFLFGCLMGEAHEINHFIVGKIVCGCWPVYRDFNVWTLCDVCEYTLLEIFPTAAGPIFSMTLAWIGMFLLRSSVAERQSLGFALIWANVPQARIATVLGGGGDEMLVIRELTQDTFLASHFKLISIVIVMIMALPPIIAVFIAVKNKWRWLINIGFLIGALAVWGAYLFGLMNSILATGFLKEPWIMGTPLLITIHTLLILVLFLIVRKNLFNMVKPY